MSPSGTFSKSSMNGARHAIAVPAAPGRYVRIGAEGVRPSLAARGSARAFHEVAETSEALSAGTVHRPGVCFGVFSYTRVHAVLSVCLLAAVPTIGFHILGRSRSRSTSTSASASYVSGLACCVAFLRRPLDRRHSRSDERQHSPRYGSDGNCEPGRLQPPPSHPSRRGACPLEDQWAHGCGKLLRDDGYSGI